MNLLLIGPRGCGKTTVGRLLAQQSGRVFVDLDDLALASFELTPISDVWKTRGEPAWRAAETAALTSALAQDHQIIALGGGTPMIEAARRLIDLARKSNLARVVYLCCPVDVLMNRLRAMPGDRPSLTGGNFIEEVPTVLAAREPTYLDIADLVYDVGNEPAADVVEGIAECLPLSSPEQSNRPNGPGGQSAK